MFIRFSEIGFVGRMIEGPFSPLIFKSDRPFPEPELSIDSSENEFYFKKILFFETIEVRKIPQSEP